VKNLASNQINLSTLKGEGELSSIDLDEQALEDVIELPTWLKIQTATCGRVFIKVRRTEDTCRAIDGLLSDSMDKLEDVTDSSRKICLHIAETRNDSTSISLAIG
jgi:hypothetical protein